MNLEAKLLVVGDNDAEQSAWVRCLRDAGYGVVEKQTAKESLECVSGEQPDLIILDTRLPDCSGMEVCRQLKADVMTAPIPIILTSALYTEAKNRIEGWESGADACLSSPVEPRELLAQVRALLRKRRSEEAVALAQRRAEDALQRHEQEFRAIFETASLGKAQADCRTRRFLLVNDALCRLTGYTREELQGLTIDEITHPEDRARDLELYNQMFSGEGGTYENEKRYIRKDGTVIWVHVSGNLISSGEGEPQRTTSVIVDITERKRAEQAQQQLSAQRQLALDAARMGWWHYDPQTKISRFDARFCEIFKITGEQRPSGEVLRRLHPDDVPRVWASVEAALNPAAPAPYSVEYRVIHDDGSVHWVQAHGVAAFEGEGAKRHATSFVGTVEDITFRKQSEQALRASERRLRTFFESGMVGTIYWNMDGKITGANDKFLQMLGYTREELNSRALDWFRMTPPEYRAADARALEELRADGVDVPYEKEYFRKDGSRIPIIVGAAMLDESKHNGMAFVLDITERKRVERELARTRERLEAALAAGDVGTWVWDIANDRVFGDRNFQGLFQRTSQETPATAEVYLQAIHPDEVGRVRREIQEVLERGDHYETEFRVQHAGATRRWLHVRGRIERDGAGKAVRMLGVSMDVTARKEAELALDLAREELRQHADNLERTVQSRTARLQELVAELEHFSYTITHDMRAPLRAMRGFAEVLKEMIADSPQPELNTFLRRIMTSAERMDILITDALSYSKAVRQDLPLAPTQLQSLLEGMLDTYPEFQTERAEIRIDGPIPPIMGNEAGLTQCFSNLLGNAVKFVNPGQRPKIRIWSEMISDSSAASTQLTPAAEVPSAPLPPQAARLSDAGSQTSGTYVRIWVEDNGIGIPEKMLSRVFDMFSRGTVNYEGTGIGLALVRKVVHRMGGRVGVRSEPGKGSSFWVDLKPGDRVDAA